MSTLARWILLARIVAAVARSQNAQETDLCRPPRHDRNTGHCYAANKSQGLACTERGGTLVYRQPTCMKADTCPSTCGVHVKWAMEDGIKEHPKYYLKQGLTQDSTPDDFLRVIAGSQGMKRGCMKACGDTNADVPWPGVLECTGTYSSAVRCYSGLNAFIGGQDTCIMIPGQESAGVQNLERPPQEVCAQHGLKPIFRPYTCATPHNLPPKCEEHVRWATTDGISQHPEWYGGLTIESVLKNAAGKAKLINLLSTKSNGLDVACPPTCSTLPKSWLTIPYPGMWVCTD